MNPAAPAPTARADGDNAPAPLAPLPSLEHLPGMTQWMRRCRFNFHLLSGLMAYLVLAGMLLPAALAGAALMAYPVREILESQREALIGWAWVLGIVGTLATIQVARLAEMNERGQWFYTAPALLLPLVGQLFAYAMLARAGMAAGWLDRRYRALAVASFAALPAAAALVYWLKGPVLQLMR